MRMLFSCHEPSSSLLAAIIESALLRQPGRVTIERLPRGPAVMGFWEGMKATVAGKRRLHEVASLVRRSRPDVAVLVGMPGFHLPLGRRLRSLGIPVALVGPPQVWAWGGWRARGVRRSADLVVCTLPFEERLFRAVGTRTIFVGYPLLDLLTEARGEPGARGPDRTLLLLPGSRPGETTFHGPLFVEVGRSLEERYAGLRVVGVPASRTGSPAQEADAARDRYRLMARADAALVVSGTATLELAILGIPQVACYHLSAPTRIAARLLVRTRNFALPNILLRRYEVAEYLEPRAGELVASLSRLLDDYPAARHRARSAAEALRAMLGPPGAPESIARALVRLGEARTGRGAA